MLAALPAVSALVSASPDAIAQQSITVLEEVIVTARRREEAIQDVPVAVTAFTGEQLRDAGITNIKELGFQVPGVQIDQTSAAQIWIRGIGQRDDGSRIDAPVGVYLDGLYLPRKDGQLLDLIDVQSVQVLRGPQGTLFGKNTTGGALLITTRGPEEEFSAWVDGRLGNHGRQDLRASVSVPIVDDLLLSRLTLGSVQRDGYQRNVTTGQEPASEDRLSGALQLRWLAGDSLTVDGLAFYSEVDELQPSTTCQYLVGSSFNGEDSLFGNRIFPGDVVPVDSGNDNDTAVLPGFIPQSATYGDSCARARRLEEDYRVTSEIPLAFKLDNLLLGLTIDWEISDTLSLKSITGYGDQEKAGNFGNPDQDAAELSLISRYRAPGSTSDREHWSQEFQLTGSAFGERLNYTAGLFAMVEKIDDGTDILTNAPSGWYIPDQRVMVIADPATERQTYELENTTYAVFFQGSYELTDQLELTAGLRWTSEKREQWVNQELLDSAAYRDVAFDALQGVEGFLPLKDLGVGLVTDLDVLMAQDIFSLIAAEFPVDELGQPVYPLQPGIRQSTDKTWDEATPMLSLAWHLPTSMAGDGLLDEGMLYFTYAEGFKSGTFEPVGIDGQATIEPELVDNYEIGFKLDMLDASMRLNGAIFHMDFDEMQLRQVLLDSGGTPRVVLNNASRTQIQGLELEWSWTPLDGLLLIATLSMNDYEYKEFDDQQFSTRALLAQQPLQDVDRSGEPFAEVPENTWSLAAQYSFNTDYGTFTPRLDYSYVDEIFMGLDAGAGQNLDQTSYDDYGLLNLRLGWLSPRAQFEGALYVTNATDELYYFGAAAVGDSTGNFMRSTAPPRMYGLEFRYNFQ
jgi:outer membrane receptor protein involved in Fe transport